MIKPINVSALNTTTQVYFDCANCGNKGGIECDLINVDKEAGIEELQEMKCPYCDYILGGYSLPKMEHVEIDKLIHRLFSKKENEHPIYLYMHFLFDENSPHARAAKFSNRIESLNQFLVRDKRVMDQNRTAVGMIFMETLKFLLNEGYVSREEYEQEYEKCIQSIVKNYE